MERPTVLLSLSDDVWPYVEALGRAGFEAITDPMDGLARLARGDALDMAVIDCDGDQAQAANVFEVLHEGRQVPTILVFGDTLPAFATAPGADEARDEYALKPLPAEALVYRLQALMIRAGRPLPIESAAWVDAVAPDSGTVGEGHVVSVFAPKGGVGKTMIAVNVAVALREQTRSSVCLLDADVGVGNVTSVLDVSNRKGLIDLADSSPEEWTDANFDEAATTHEPSGVRVLTWGSAPGDFTRVTADLLLAAVRWARAHHSYVVIDTHPSYDDRTMAMLSVSNEIFLVVTPEVGPINTGAQFLVMAREVGLGGIVKVIVNRADHGISNADIAQTLGMAVSATIVSNGPKAVLAANEGTPLISRFPRERISTDLHGVARLLTREEAAPQGARGRQWLPAFGSRS
jgi:MinD-like ATPase involved in chromosome partitioning or flagellar assembly